MRRATRWPGRCSSTALGKSAIEPQAAALPGQRPQPGDGGYRAVEHGVPGTRHPGVGRGQAGGRRAAAIPVAARLEHINLTGDYVWRQSRSWKREVSAFTDARKTLAYDFFRILRAPLSHLRKAEREAAALDLAERPGAQQARGTAPRPTSGRRSRSARRPPEAERGREAWTLGQGMKKPVAGCYGRLTRWKGGGDVVYMALL